MDRVPDVNFFIRQRDVDFLAFNQNYDFVRGVFKITITITTITTPVVVARGGRERSNPAKTTTALRDGS